MRQSQRQSHKKSRTGCQTCKRRKVKCDENKPQCGNCIKFGIQCDFSVLSLQPVRSRSTSASSTPSRRRGRPRGEWDSWAQQIRLESFQNTQKSCGSGLSVQDLQLFYHYLNHTGRTMEQDSLWCEGIPELGFQNPCVLHLILAFSAHHMVHKGLGDATRLADISEKHTTSALEIATPLLKYLNKDTSPTLYITSVLVCLIAFAKGPAHGDLLLVSGNGEVSWFSLLKGVRMVIAMTGWDAVFSGPLAKHFPQPSPTDETDETHSDASPQSDPAIQADWETSLDQVSLLLASYQSEELSDRLDSLKECFQHTFSRTKQTGPDSQGKLQTIIGWIYGTDDTFIKGLEENELVPNILLGHFCVLLHTVRRFWFIDGWAKHILDEVFRRCEASHEWLVWPVRILNSAEE